MATQAVVQLVVDASQAASDVESQLNQIVNDAEDGAPAINVNAQTADSAETDIISGLLLIIRDAENQAPPIDLVAAATANRVDAQVAQIVQDAEDGASTIDLNVDVDALLLAEASGALDDIADSAEGAADETDRFGDALARVDSFARSVGRIGVLIGGAGVAAAGAAKLVAGLVVSLENIAPAAAVGATSLLTIAAANVTLKLGLSGVQDALTQVFATEPDAEALAKAMKNLSPAARGFVTTLQEMRPAFDELRLDVQERIFSGLADRFKELSPLGSTVRKTLRDMADSFNAVGDGVIDAAKEVGEDGSLGQALASSTAGMRTLEQIPAKILRSLVRLAAAGGPLFERFANRISLAVGNISQRIERSFESGALENAVNKAGAALAQLGRVLANVGGILNNVFGTLATSGAGLFGILENITATLKDATATTVFRDAMVSLSSVLESLGRNIAPLLSIALQAVAGAITILAPTVVQLLDTLGPQLQEVFRQLVPVVLELANVISELALIVLPLIPSAVQATITIIPVLAELLQDLVVVIRTIAPVVIHMAQTFIDQMNLLAVILGGLVDTFKTSFRVIGAVLTGDFGKALALVQGLFRRWVDRIRGHLTTMNIDAFRAGQRLGRDFRQQFNQALESARERVRSGIAAIVADIRSLPGRARAALGNLSQTLSSSGRALVQGFINGVRSQISAVAEAASSVVAAARDFFPFSPAKKGPFSGRGYTTFSGQALVNDFAKGILSQRHALAQSVGRLFSEPNLSPLLRPQFASTGGGAAATPFLSGPASVGAPSVAVYIGNERLNGFVDARIDGRNIVRDRQAAQGARF